MTVVAKRGTSYEFKKEWMSGKDIKFFLSKFDEAEYAVTETIETIKLDWSHKIASAQELKQNTELTYSQQYGNKSINMDFLNRRLTSPYQIGGFNPYAQMFIPPYNNFIYPYGQHFTQFNSPDYETRQNTLFNNNMFNDLNGGDLNL